MNFYNVRIENPLISTQRISNLVEQSLQCIGPEGRLTKNHNQNEKKQEFLRFSKVSQNEENVQKNMSLQNNTQASIPTNPQYKSKNRSLMIGFIISFSGLIFGYGLTAISVVNISQIIIIYHINLSQYYASSLLIGIMPVGGIIGAGINQLFIKYFNRKHSIYLMCIILWIGLCLMLIHNQYTIILGRFVEGVAVGLYVSISPIFLKQVTPKELRPIVMNFFGLSKALGIVIAYCLQNLFIIIEYTSNAYMILLTFNGFIAIIQIILFYFFVPHSPLQLIQKRKLEQSKQELRLIYQQQYIQQIFSELIQDYQIQCSAVQIDDSPKKQNKNQFTKNHLKKQLKKAYHMGIHVIILRQFIGANCIVTFSGQIIEPFAPTVSTYMALILNVIQLIFNILNILFIKAGRRPLLLFGTASMSLICLGISLVLIYKIQIVILLFMSIYMALNGGTLLPVGWAYPSQILAPEVTMIPNIIGWICISIVTSIPPLVVGLMPDNNAYPLFLFFGGYGIFALFILKIWMKESKGLTYEQIIESF